MTNLAKQIETLETTIAAGETYASRCQPREQEKIEGILFMQRYKLNRLYMLKSLEHREPSRLGLHSIARDCR